MTYKVKIRNLQSGKEYFAIMGDSYKPFEDHFVNIVSSFTKKWIYESEDKHAKCFGRTLTMEFLEIWKAKGKFVSFGGLKFTPEENYDSKVDEHNNSKSYPRCKHLKDINFIQDLEYLPKLIKQNRILKESEITALTGSEVTHGS